MDGLKSLLQNSICGQIRPFDAGPELFGTRLWPTGYALVAKNRAGVKIIKSGLQSEFAKGL